MIAKCKTSSMFRPKSNTLSDKKQHFSRDTVLVSTPHFPRWWYFFESILKYQVLGFPYYCSVLYQGRHFPYYEIRCYRFPISYISHKIISIISIITQYKNKQDVNSPKQICIVLYLISERVFLSRIAEKCWSFTLKGKSNGIFWPPVIMNRTHLGLWPLTNGFKYFRL